MPTGAPRPCTEPGCPKLITTGRCEAHTKKHNWQHTTSSSSRGYGAQWRKAKEKVHKRDYWLCQSCLPAMVKGTHCDHIIPKNKGGTDDMTNLQTLCKACHDIKTAREDSK